MIWADGQPTVQSTGGFLPIGYELGSLQEDESDDNFIILSDHNRQGIDVSTERIEQRQRMANGTMRSFFIADKLSISTSWTMLPSRSFAVDPEFNNRGEPNIILPRDKTKPIPDRYFADKSEQYTVDGGAGGAELLSWYENHTGPFWVLISYDKYTNFKDDENARNNLAEYSEARQMYISDFSYSITKRGGSTYDMWDVSVSLEEV